MSCDPSMQIVMTCCVNTVTGNMVDNEAQDRASTAGEIIGSFMAGVMVAATIILLTGKFTRILYNIILLYQHINCAKIIQ